MVLDIDSSVFTKMDLWFFLDSVFKRLDSLVLQDLFFKGFG